MSGRATLWDSTPSGNDEESFDGSLHVIPNFEFDLMHISHRSCWCEPVIDTKAYDEDNEVWLHRMVQ